MNTSRGISRSVLVLALSSVVLLSQLHAQLSPEEEAALFGLAAEPGSSDTTSTEPGDSGSASAGAVITDIPAPDMTNDQAPKLDDQGVRLGGRISMNLGGGIDPLADTSNNPWAWYQGSSLQLGSRLFLDARPAKGSRVLLKLDLSYNPDPQNQNPTSLVLRELFADLMLFDTVFVRAGKQTLNWGVGYFFSPANLLNLQSINPDAPEEELLGPLALKLQLPIGGVNLYLNTLLDDLTRDLGPVFAPKLDFTLGNAEFGLGARLQFDRPWAFMSTLSLGLGDFSLFAEGVLEGRLQKNFVVKGGPFAGSALGVVAEKRESELFPSATIGGSWRTSNDEGTFSFSLLGQYWFNGKGYADPTVLLDHRSGLGALLAQSKIGVSDLMNPGQHYLGLSVSLPNLLKTKLAPSLFWFANLGDGSGRLRTSLSYGGLEIVQISVSYNLNYGRPGSEFLSVGSDPALFGSTTAVEYKHSFGFDLSLSADSF